MTWNGLECLLKRKVTYTHQTKMLLTNFLKNGLVINSITKANVVLYVLAFAIVAAVDPAHLRASRTGHLLIGLVLLIVVVGIGRFLNTKFNFGFLGDTIIYINKLAVLLVYTLMFMSSYIMDPSSTKFLFGVLIVTVIYSVVFLKSVIDGLSSSLVFITSLVFLYLYNIAMAGLAFGYYYLGGNRIYGLFDNPQNYWGSDWVTGLSIVFKGLIYFYTMPSSSFSKDIYHLIPFLEYIFGYIVNIGIIGFFVSYMSSKMLHKE